MANGDILKLDPHRFATLLLDADATASVGQWVEVPAWFNIRSYWTDLTTADTIQIMGSNAQTQPANATDGVPIGTSVTSTTKGFTSVDAFRWIKAKKTGTAQAATVILEAARNE